MRYAKYLFAAMFCFSTPGSCQDSRVEAAEDRRGGSTLLRILPNLDRDLDGVIRPDEIRPAHFERIQFLLAQLDISVGSSIVVEDVMKQLEQQQEGVSQTDLPEANEWLVPPFGEEEDLDDLPLPFGEVVESDADGESHQLEQGSTQSSEGDVHQLGQEAGNSTYGSSDRRYSPPRNREPRSGDELEQLKARMDRYTDALMRRFDLDENGELDSSEIRRMPGSWSVVDNDSDGILSKEDILNELIRVQGRVEMVGQPSRSEGNTATQPASQDDESERGDVYRFRTIEERLAHLPSEFFDMDKNRDGQIQMNEFVDVFTSENVQAFKAADRDGNLIISSEEWLAIDRNH